MQSHHQYSLRRKSRSHGHSSLVCLDCHPYIVTVSDTRLLEELYSSLSSHQFFSSTTIITLTDNRMYVRVKTQHCPVKVAIIITLAITLFCTLYVIATGKSSIAKIAGVLFHLKNNGKEVLVIIIRDVMHPN